MNKQLIKAFLLMSVTLIFSSVNAQTDISAGFTGSFARFYPETVFFGQGLNNQADNGFGWSAGLFVEKKLNARLTPVVEINFTNLASNFYLENNYHDREGYYVGHVEKAFSDISFEYVTASAGAKYYLGNTLFLYPGFEIARPLNKKIDLMSIMYYAREEWVSSPHVKNRYLNKTNYSAKLGIGVDLKAIDVILEYVYGLNYQLSFFDYSEPFGINHRNRHLQLKVQVPIYKR